LNSVEKLICCLLFLGSRRHNTAHTRARSIADARGKSSPTGARMGVR